MMMGIAAPAAAARPERTPLELPPSIEFAAGEICPFAVTVTFLENRGKDITFFNRSGDPVRSIGSGKLQIAMTNTDDPDEPTITLNVSGPIHTKFHPDGSSTSIYGGRSISLYPAGTSVLTAGRAIVELGPEGEFVSVTNIGREVDTCALLAG